MKTIHPVTNPVRTARPASTGPAKAGAVATAALPPQPGPEAIILGIDVAKARHVVARYVAGEGAKPAEGMTETTLLARVAKWRKAGLPVHCVYAAGPDRADGMSGRNWPALPTRSAPQRWTTNYKATSGFPLA